MRLVRIGSTFLLSASLSFAFSLGDITKMATESLKSPSPKTDSTTNDSQSLTAISAGLKEALSQGVKIAVESLGKENGYLNNAQVKIPLPDTLSKAELLIRKAGANQYADDLIVAMNKAASQAAPKTAEIFLNAIQKMSINDANKILSGTNTAATQYFKNNSSTQLKELIMPLVQKSIENNNVAKYYDAFNSAYKTYGKGLVENSQVMGYAKSFGVDTFIPKGDDKSLDEYITTKAIDGLFTMIEKEESAIRENPINRTSDLLKQIFK